MTATAPTRRATWLEQPHHDGSGALRLRPAARASATRVDVLLRVPLECGRGCRARAHQPRRRAGLQLGPPCAHDGHRRVVAGVDLTCHNPVTNYRFLLAGGPTKYAWLNGTGLHGCATCPTRATSASSPTTRRRPPGRRARSSTRSSPTASPGRRRPTVAELPEWAVPAAWGDPVDPAGKAVGHQLYGGDLDGVVDHLDHLEALGVDVVYLTPFFPARSNHRYDASSFERGRPPARWRRRRCAG